MYSKRRWRQAAGSLLKGIDFDFPALTMLILVRSEYASICAARSLRRIEEPNPTFGVERIAVVRPTHVFWNSRVGKVHWTLPENLSLGQYASRHQVPACRLSAVFAPK